MLELFEKLGLRIGLGIVVKDERILEILQQIERKEVLTFIRNNNI